MVVIKFLIKVVLIFIILYKFNSYQIFFIPKSLYNFCYVKFNILVKELKCTYGDNQWLRISKKENFRSSIVDKKGNILAKTVTVPADTTLVVSDTPIYLMEGDVLKGGASAASDLDLFVSFEVLDDA